MCLAYSHWVFFCTSYIPNTLAFWRKLEDSSPFLRVPFSIFDVRHIPEEALKFPVIFIFHIPFRASCWSFSLLLIHLSHLRSPLLPPGCLFPPFFSGGFLGSALPKRFPIFLRVQNSWRDWSAPASNILRIIIPAFLFCISVTKKVSWDIFPSLLRYYSDGNISSSLYWGGEN